MSAQLRLSLAWLAVLAAITTYAEYHEKAPLFYGTFSENFVDRWGFQSIADHCYDPRIEAFPTTPSSITTFDPSLVKPGDIIFVRNIKEFFLTLHTKITNPYIIITAGDYKDAVKEEFLDFLNDENIIAWFCVHPCPQTHPKFHAIPLGIFQRREFYNKRNSLTRLFAQWRHMPREHLLSTNFGLRPKFKPARNDIFDIFKDKDFCQKLQPQPFLEYMKKMAQFKFVLSPQGMAPDTYRTWEALLVGTIPIVEASHLDPLYADLPILIIQDLHEVTPAFLEKKYLEFKAQKFNVEKLFMKYWWKKIKDVQHRFLLQ